MAYRVELTSKAKKQLTKMDRFDAARIISWIEKNLEGIEIPRRIGDPLRGNHAGTWRYKVGVYRILCDIQDDVLVIQVIAVGHRKDIYKS